VLLLLLLLLLLRQQLAWHGKQASLHDALIAAAPALSQRGSEKSAGRGGEGSSRSQAAVGGWGGWWGWVGWGEGRGPVAENHI